jgi:hypothetical protein
MNPLIVPFIVAPVFCISGIIVGVFVRKVPMRGWIAISLLILSALFWTLGEPNDNSTHERVWLLHCFIFTAPIAVIYSFRAHILAPDRLLARAAFFASFVIALAFLFMLCGIIYGPVLIISSPHVALNSN